jgi:hypothetical protein
VSQISCIAAITDAKHISYVMLSHVSRLHVRFRSKLLFLRRGVVSPTINTQAGGTPLVGCPRLLIQYIHSYPPYLEAVSSRKRDEVTGGWRKPHNEELHNLYCSLSIIRMSKSRRMR